MASLTETAKAVLEGKVLEEGIPTVGPLSGGVSNPNPVDPSTASTGNAKTLRPGSKSVEGRHTNPGAADPKSLGAEEDLGGQTPTQLPTENLGAKSAGKVGKDTSRSGQASVKAEPAKKLSAMAEEMEDEGEVFEESETLSLAERLKALKEARKMKKHEEEDEKEEKHEKMEEEEQIDEATGLKKVVHKVFGKQIAKHRANKADSEMERTLNTRGSEKKWAKNYDARERYGRIAAGKPPFKDMDEEAQIDEELEDFINEAIEAGLSEEEIMEAIDENFEFVSEESEEIAEELESYEVDMSEHVEALLAGEDLSEEFHAKATTIFEAAVKSKLEEEVALLEQAYAETLEERVNEIMEELASSVDDYLNYVVEQWIEENEVAVESALRSELTEDFISGLRSLFAEHYIDIPEEEVDVVEELSAANEELEAKLNEEIERNVALTSMLSESRKAELTSVVCEGLTSTQAGKLQALAENVEYTSDEDFIEKVSTLRENYFPVTVKTNEVLDRVESTDPQSLTEATLEGPMSRYVQALGRSLPK